MTATFLRPPSHNAPSGSIMIEIEEEGPMSIASWG